MNQQTKNVISERWSRSPIRIQLQIIKDYVDQHGRNNTEHWFGYLQELFDCHDLRYVNFITDGE